MQGHAADCNHVLRVQKHGHEAAVTTTITRHKCGHTGQATNGHKIANYRTSQCATHTGWRIPFVTSLNLPQPGTGPCRLYKVRFLLEQFQASPTYCVMNCARVCWFFCHGKGLSSYKYIAMNFWESTSILKLRIFPNCAEHM